MASVTVKWSGALSIRIIVPLNRIGGLHLDRNGLSRGFVRMLVRMRSTDAMMVGNFRALRRLAFPFRAFLRCFKRHNGVLVRLFGRLFGVCHIESVAFFGRRRRSNRVGHCR